MNGDHTLITAHTGSGKTLPAEFAIEHFVNKLKKKVIYTTPVKALSNEKYYTLSKKYPKSNIIACEVFEDGNINFREDKVSDGGYREKVISNAPESEDGFFLVPKVVD